MSENSMQTACVSAWRLILVASGLLCVVACGDGSSGRGATMPTATPAVSPGTTPSPFEGRVFAIGSWLDADPFGFAVVRSENGGRDFARVFTTDAFRPGGLGFTFVDASRGWAIASRRGEMARILRTVDGGVSWVSQTENIVVEDETLVTLADIAFSSAERGVAVGVFQMDLRLSERPAILLTVDGGNVWRSVVAPSRAASLGSVCLTAGGTGLAVGSSAVSGPLVVRTDDGGATWHDITTELALDLSADPRTVSCIETDQLWIGGKALRHPRPGLPIPRATLLFSPDNGGTWLDLTPPALTNFRDSVRSLDFTDATHGWALAERGPAVFRTDDSGPTWIEPALPAGVPSSASEEGLTVFHTNDAGATWVEQALPTDASHRLVAVDFRDTQHGVVVGGIVGEGTLTRGLAFFTTDGGNTWAPAATLPDDSRGFQDVAFPAD